MSEINFGARPQFDPSHAAKAAWPRFLSLLEYGLVLVDKIGPNTSSNRAADQVALLLIQKQLTHASSVLLLRDHLDSMLIVRAMFELTAAMAWIFSGHTNADSRAKQWVDHSTLERWRQLQVIRQAGLTDPPDAAEIDRAFKLAEDSFLNDAGRAAKRKGKALNPHTHVSIEWQKCSVWQMFKETGLESFYRGSYSHFSAWHHGSISGVATMFSGTGGDFGLRLTGDDISAHSGNAAFFCLNRTLLEACAFYSLFDEYSELIKMSEEFCLAFDPPAV